ncbi:hypothetical protein Tsubulata_042428 [Turnera subulata]|uniref:Uncharacterized protein n=1 Tax=Turnera subulata TaxID=218843 RepID=A0A9Q0G622_9ROSI|nr:hypothetical protein Tsubulata_042428 [Turnera subulata]
MGWRSELATAWRPTYLEKQILKERTLAQGFQSINHRLNPPWRMMVLMLMRESPCVDFIAGMIEKEVKWISSLPLKPNTFLQPPSLPTQPPLPAQAPPSRIVNPNFCSPKYIPSLSPSYHHLSSPNSPSSLDSSLTPNTRSNIALQNLDKALKSKRITTRKREKKPKQAIHSLPSSTCSHPTETAPNSSPQISSPSPTYFTHPVPFCSHEADPTIQIGDSFGWDCSNDPDGVRDATVALIVKEGFYWCKSRTV